MAIRSDATAVSSAHGRRRRDVDDLVDGVIRRCLSRENISPELRAWLRLLVLAVIDAMEEQSDA
jgi:hypothetical protein